MAAVFIDAPRYHLLDIQCCETVDRAEQGRGAEAGIAEPAEASVHTLLDPVPDESKGPTGALNIFGMTLLSLWSSAEDAVKHIGLFIRIADITPCGLKETLYGVIRILPPGFLHQLFKMRRSCRRRWPE